MSRDAAGTSACATSAYHRPVEIHQERLRAIPRSSSRSSDACSSLRMRSSGVKARSSLTVRVYRRVSGDILLE
jgi:hypothetical protein